MTRAKNIMKGVCILANTKREMRKMSMDYKSLIKKATGDLVILGQKDTCKTTLLMHLARELRKDPTNRTIIFETFPKWVHSFDTIPYMTIRDNDVQPKENMPFLEQDRAIIQWSKDYSVLMVEQLSNSSRQTKTAVS